MSNPDPLETAWTVHAAQVDWTGKVDTKASFALALESALIAGVVTISGEGGVLGSVSGWLLWPYWIGAALLGVSTALSMAVVFPQLRARHLAKEASDGAYVYFGHARRHTPDELKTLITNEPTLDQVATQIVQMAKIAWRKHRLLQGSLLTALAGASGVTWAGLGAAQL